MKCLIVEDEDLAREGLIYFLTDYAEIETAVNGLEALEMYRRGLQQGNPFDLVLLDIVMPEMDGQEALKQIRRMEEELGAKKCVIIMTTALNSPENMEEALWEGDCTDYLVKPLVRADLLAMLRRYQLI
jgi:two-component system chemotaxis response regulator CheY